jgi:hypothetical protein
MEASPQDVFAILKQYMSDEEVMQVILAFPEERVRDDCLVSLTLLGSFLSSYKVGGNKVVNSAACKHPGTPLNTQLRHSQL